MGEMNREKREGEGLCMRDINGEQKEGRFAYWKDRQGAKKEEEGDYEGAIYMGRNRKGEDRKEEADVWRRCMGIKMLGEDLLMAEMDEKKREDEGMLVKSRRVAV